MLILYRVWLSNKNFAKAPNYPSSEALGERTAADIKQNPL
jgi:hypothetical protein